MGETLSEGIRDHAVASLEADLGLEGVRVDCSDLLQRDIGAVEETCIIGAGALITCNVEVLISNVCRIRINVDLDATIQGADQGAGGVVNASEAVVTRQCGGVIQDACHAKCRSNVSGADQDVTLAATSLLTDRVCISFDLEEKTLEFLNRPATVGVNVEVEDTSVSSVVLSTSNSVGVDGSNNFTVDLSEDLSREDVSELLLSI